MKIQRRLEVLKAETSIISGEYITLMEQWEKHRPQAAIIFKQQQDDYFEEAANDYFTDYVDEDRTPPPSSPVAEEEEQVEEELSLPVPENGEDISSETFNTFVPVRILRGKNHGVRAYFLEYESPKVVLVMLNKDPMEQATVFKSSISRIGCSLSGCVNVSTKPKKSFPYDFGVLLCAEHI